MCLYFVFCFVLRFTFHVLCSASCVLCFVFCVFLFSFLLEYFMRTTHRSKFFLVNEPGIPPLIYGGEANMHPLASCLSSKGNEEDSGESVNEPSIPPTLFFSAGGKTIAWMYRLGLRLACQETCAHVVVPGMDRGYKRVTLHDTLMIPHGSLITYFLPPELAD